MSTINTLLRRFLLLPVAVLLLFLVQVTFWASDRAPPFKVLYVEPAIGHAGGSVRLIASVRRDLKRECSVKFTRQLFDGAGSRHDLEGEQRMSAEAIRDMDRRTPNRLDVTVPVPVNAVAGNAAVVTSLEYACNPVHLAFPIRVKSELPFIIAGAEQ